MFNWEPGIALQEIEVPYVFDWEPGIALHAMPGVSGLILRQGGSLMSFLELQQAPGVYSRVTARMAI